MSYSGCIANARSSFRLSSMLASAFFFSNLGPAKVMAMDPMGAVIKMTKTAIVSTLSPNACLVLYRSLFSSSCPDPTESYKLSNATGPSAA